MMRFTCERCGKRYAAPQIVPVPGRIYRLKCKGCGHLISVNGRDALRTGEGVQAAAPGASGLAAVDSTPAASASSFLDALHVSGPAAEPEAPPGPAHAAGPGPESRDPFALENIVERWPPEVTGSRPLVGVPPDVSGAPPPAADGVPQAPEDAPTAACHARSVLGPVDWEPEETAAPAPPRRRSRMRVAALAAVLLACAVFLAWQYIPHLSSARPGAAAGSPGPATPSAPQGAATPRARPAEPASAAPAAPDAAAPAPAPAADAGPPAAGSTDPEARAPVPGAPPRLAPAPAKRALPTPAHPQASAARPAPRVESTQARAGPPPLDDAADPAPEERLTQDAIDRVLGAGRGAFDACLRDPSRGLDQPLGARQVTLRLTVAAEGSVADSSIDDVAVSSAQVGQCLQSAARNLRFPAFKGDAVTVDHPVAIPAD